MLCLLHGVKLKSLLTWSKGFLLWCLQESNQGHTDFQSVALPTELRHQRIRAANLTEIFIFQKEILKKHKLTWRKSIYITFNNLEFSS